MIYPGQDSVLSLFGNKNSAPSTPPPPHPPIPAPVELLDRPVFPDNVISIHGRTPLSEPVRPQGGDTREPEAMRTRIIIHHKILVIQVLYIHQLYELVNLEVFVSLAGGGGALPTRGGRRGFYLQFRVEIPVYWKHYLFLLQNV